MTINYYFWVKIFYSFPWPGIKAKNRFNPTIIIDVINDKIQIKLPVTPTPSQAFCFPGNNTGVTDPGIHICFIIRTELPQVNRDIAFFCPGINAIEIPLDALNLFHGTKPADSGFINMLR